ncbi:hypothetical protein AAEU33_17645 [Chryseobacterium sp. Chry.R1]|uniref:hypothetical protein n=1 Tax=Chryseobacterium sp. Chry.R1 TaxID=3139392 RepID=UPI0031F7454E
MKIITITLPLSPDYHNESADLKKAGYTISFEFFHMAFYRDGFLYRKLVDQAIRQFIC